MFGGKDGCGLEGRCAGVCVCVCVCVCMCVCVCVCLNLKACGLANHHFICLNGVAF